MQLGETVELAGKTYCAASQVGRWSDEGECTGCAFVDSAALCGKAGPCDGVIFVERPAPDYSPILAGILAGKQIQYGAADGWIDKEPTAVFGILSVRPAPSKLRVKPDTWVVNGVELPVLVEFEPGAPSPTGLPAYAFVGYVVHENQIPRTVRRFGCATEADAKALYDAITSSLPKAPT